MGNAKRFEFFYDALKDEYKFYVDDVGARHRRPSNPRSTSSRGPEVQATSKALAARSLHAAAAAIQSGDDRVLRRAMPALRTGIRGSALGNGSSLPANRRDCWSV